MPVRVRFAPSPTGYLHVGGARTALFNWMFARKSKGTFILRIEDTDVQRSSEEMVTGILDALTWLGLTWDEGPYYQSARLENYRRVAQELVNRNVAYPCFCDPGELERIREAKYQENKSWKYDRRCLALTPEERQLRIDRGDPYAIRFRVPEQPDELKFLDHVHGELKFRLEELEDFVLLRSDGYPTYQLAVVVDDHDLKISHVIRGDDHIANTPKQILLYQALDWTIPEFSHVPLILGPDRTRLSKRHGAVSVLQYRDDGFLSEAMCNYLALLGWYPPDNREVQDLNSMVSQFRLNDINRANPVFDVAKLEWMNAEYIKATPGSVLLERLSPWLSAKGWWEEIQKTPQIFIQRIDLLKTRMHRLSDFINLGEAFFTESYTIDEDAARKRWKFTHLATMLESLVRDLNDLQDFHHQSIEQCVRNAAERVSVKPAVLIHALRVLLTGRSVGPGLFELMEVLGRDIVTARIIRRLDEVRAYESGSQSSLIS